MEFLAPEAIGDLKEILAYLPGLSSKDLKEDDLNALRSFYITQLKQFNEKKKQGLHDSQQDEILQQLEEEMLRLGIARISIDALVKNGVFFKLPNGKMPSHGVVVALSLVRFFSEKTGVDIKKIVFSISHKSDIEDQKKRLSEKAEAWGLDVALLDSSIGGDVFAKNVLDIYGGEYGAMATLGDKEIFAEFVNENKIPVLDIRETWELEERGTLQEVQDALWLKPGGNTPDYFQENFWFQLDNALKNLAQKNMPVHELAVVCANNIRVTVVFPILARMAGAYGIEKIYCLKGGLNA